MQDQSLIDANPTIELSPEKNDVQTSMIALTDLNVTVGDHNTELERSPPKARAASKHSVKTKGWLSDESFEL